MTKTKKLSVTECISGLFKATTTLIWNLVVPFLFLFNSWVIFLLHYDYLSTFGILLFSLPLIIFTLWGIYYYLMLFGIILPEHMDI